MTTAVAPTPEPKPTTAVARKPATLIDIIASEGFKSQMAMVLPKHLTPDRMARIAITMMRKVPKLQKCTQESLLGALMTLSQFGLEADGRRAHLIPFENRKEGTVECQLIIDYKGLAELALRSGLVSTLHADIIRRGDLFDYDSGRIAKHVPWFLRNDKDRPDKAGEVFAAYAIVVNKDGTQKSEVMSFDDIEGIRKRSRAGSSGPWVTDWNEMAKKTVFRRLSKWLVLSPEFRDAVEADDDELIETTAVTVTRQTLADLVAIPEAEIVVAPDAETVIEQPAVEPPTEKKAEPKAAKTPEPPAEDAKPYWLLIVSECKDVPSLNRKHSQFESVKKDMPEADAQAIEEAFAKRVTEV